jgi:hypothetical protein
VSESEWQQVKRLFHQALDLRPDEQKAFLDRACIDNEDLRRKVESLLRAHEQAGEFIAEPALIEGPCD